MASYAKQKELCQKLNIEEEDLIILYDNVFEVTHSNGFKKSEISDLLTDSEYWFNEKPKSNWKTELFDTLSIISDQEEEIEKIKELLNRF